MLYIYSAMLISALLCVTGVVLSLINLQKYNFGLYMALLAIVVFSIALAFFVVKPKACLGPRWFVKLFRKSTTTATTTNRNGRDNAEGTDENSQENGGRRRLMFFGFNTTALFQSDLHQNGYNTSTPDSKTIQRTNSRLLDLGRSNYHPQCGELERNTIVEEPPSTTLIPPTPPSLDDDQERGGEWKEEENEENRTRVRAWTLLNRNGEKEDEKEGRVRAWTFTCANSVNNRNNKSDRINSEECWRQWQEFLFRQNGPALMLRSSFPLSERIAPPSRHHTTSSSQPKSWSTETVVNLDEFLRTPRKTRSAEKNLTTKSSSSSEETHSDDQTGQSKPIRKNALSPADCSHSWKRSHTVTVKYVPVRQEWIPKPLSVMMDVGLYRKKSRSSNAVSAMLTWKEGSPWWSLSNLFQRATSNQAHQRRDRADECML